MAKTKRPARTAEETTAGSEVSFDLSRRDRELVTRIVERAVQMYAIAGVDLDKLSLAMDIEATHANGNPLRLADFASAGNFDFAHDVSGIIRHIDRNTGKLTGCFVPRFSR